MALFTLNWTRGRNYDQVVAQKCPVLFYLTDSKLLTLNLILNSHIIDMIILVCYKLIDLIVQSDLQIQVHIFIRNFI